MMNRLLLGVFCPNCGKEVYLELKSPNLGDPEAIHAHAEFEGVPLICESCTQVFLYRRHSKHGRMTTTRRCPACEHG